MIKRFLGEGNVLAIEEKEGWNEKRFEGIVYLDRDGVLIEDYGYVGETQRVKLISGAREFVQEARSKNIMVAIITNQSGIGRGYYDWNAYVKVTIKMLDLLGPNAQPNIIVACGITPNSKSTDRIYRKPNKGMIDYIRSKVKTYNLSFELLVGDKKSDIECGLKANIKNNVHVLTGHGEKERSALLSTFQPENYKHIQTKDSIADLRGLLI